MFKKSKDKKKFVFKIKKKLEKSLSIVILNFSKLSANNLNLFRKNAKNNNVNFMVVRNNLLKISIMKSSLDYLKSFLVGPIILGYSTKNYGGLFKVLDKFLVKYKNNLVLKCILIDKKKVSLKLSKKLSFLSSIKKCLSYLIFILKDFFLFRLLRSLLIIKSIKC